MTYHTIYTTSSHGTQFDVTFVAKIYMYICLYIYAYMINKVQMYDVFYNVYHVYYILYSPIFVCNRGFVSIEINGSETTGTNKFSVAKPG